MELVIALFAAVTLASWALLFRVLDQASAERRAAMEVNRMERKHLREGHQAVIDAVRASAEKRELKLLDRLMARDVWEAKGAEAMDDRTLGDQTILTDAEEAQIERARRDALKTREGSS